MPSVEECFKHTDLEWRLAQIPESACCRGVYLNNLDSCALSFGPETQKEYRDFFQLFKFKTFSLYPIKDYLTRLCVLAQLRFGSPSIYEGIHEIQAKMPQAWAKTLLGRATMGIIGPDFGLALRIMKKSQENSINYGSMQLTSEGNGFYRASFRNEYVYIEHAMTGGIDGLALACGANVQLTTVMADTFNGEIQIQVL
jgi:uncharacterized protein (TIGR02265 family)